MVQTCKDFRGRKNYCARVSAILDNRCSQFNIWNHKEPKGPSLLSTLHEREEDSAEGLVSHIEGDSTLCVHNNLLLHDNTWTIPQMHLRLLQVTI